MTAPLPLFVADAAAEMLADGLGGSLQPLPRLPPGALDLHAPGLLALYRDAARLPPGREVRAKVFRPEGSDARGTVTHVGAWCFDPDTPLHQGTWDAARRAARCAVGAAKVLDEAHLAYAACDPGGHHAGPERFGGGSYLNHAAIAARALARHGRVTILDIAALHGNGTQALFYRHPDVQTVSIHGPPSECFPFTTGHGHELGAGPGRGRNLNVPLAFDTDGEGYLEALDGHVLAAIQSFAPARLVLVAGFDTRAGHPSSPFALTRADLGQIGQRIGALGLPTAVVQEGATGAAMLPSARALLDGLRQEQRTKAPS